MALYSYGLSELRLEIRITTHIWCPPTTKMLPWNNGNVAVGIAAHMGGSRAPKRRPTTEFFFVSENDGNVAPQ